MSDEEKFDPLADLAEMAAKAPPLYGRKLSFPEKCGLFAALHLGQARSGDIEKAYNLSQPTVSALKNCLRNELHYCEVANEFRRMSPSEFALKYWTQEIRARLKAARLDRMDLIEELPAIADGPDPRANQYAGDYNFPHQTGPDAPIIDHRYRIYWERRDSPGWAVEDLETGEIGGEGSQTGMPTGKPYRTSRDAVIDLYTGYGLQDECPAQKIGRPRK